jgi:hypothetical protein
VFHRSRTGLASATLLAASALAVAAVPVVTTADTDGGPAGPPSPTVDDPAVDAATPAAVHRTTVTAADAELIRRPRGGGMATAAWLLLRHREVTEQRALVPDVQRLAVATDLATLEQAPTATGVGTADEEPATVHDEPVPVAATEPVDDAEAAEPVYVGQDGETIDLARLRTWLEGRGSPMAPYAADLLAAGIAHDVDPRLVIGIAAIESTVGEQLPPGSHNAWGWSGDGPHGLKVWPSWPEAIDDFTERLGRLYDTTSIDERMAQTYCPPNWRKWLDTVRWVVDDI